MAKSNSGGWMTSVNSDLASPVQDKWAAVDQPSSELVMAFVRASKAPNTVRGYRADWRDFCRWCKLHGLKALPAAPESVAGFIAERAGRLKPGSIQRRLNAIGEAQKAARIESPTHAAVVRNVMKGIRRTRCAAPTQKTAAVTDDIRAMLYSTDSGIIGARDRALILLGFADARSWSH